MKTKIIRLMMALPLIVAPSVASAEMTTSGGYLLQLQVPVSCTVKQQSAIAAQGNGYVLGNLHEYCNAPQGYSLVVNYAPGSLRGAVVAVGEERVTLDGSGHTVVSHAIGPRIRDREVFAAPGASGFDTDHLEFQIETN